MSPLTAQEPHWPSLGVAPEKVLSSLWESSLIGLTLVTEEGYWLHPSPTLCGMLEYTQSELEKLACADVTHPLDVSDDLHMAKLVAERNIGSYVMSKRYITKTGKVLWIKLHVSGLYAEDGKLVMYLSQIAPAEIFNPSSPLVRKTIPVETKIRKFLAVHWKWLTIATAAAVVTGYKLWQAYHLLMGAYTEGTQ